MSTFSKAMKDYPKGSLIRASRLPPTGFMQKWELTAPDGKQWTLFGPIAAVRREVVTVCEMQIRVV